MIFGQFLEHFHRQVYGGAFEPGSPLADERGFRTDVIAALRELKVPVVRWPGGCFASAYHWRDRVGARREPAFDKAWRVEEPNSFGTDEFVAWCLHLQERGHGEPGGDERLVEYRNQTKGRWTRLR